MKAFPIVANFLLSSGLVFCAFAETHPSFVAGMERFEAAKRAGDFVTGEKALREALVHGRSEYAVGSLAWTQTHQGKTEEALKTA